GMEDADDFFDAYTQKGPFLQLEAGQISPDEFRGMMRQKLPAGVTDSQIDRGLSLFLCGIPETRLDLLRRLRADGHRVWLLSNTNPIMWHNDILPEFRKQGLEITDYFDGTVTSFEAKVCKPDSRIYEYALAKFGIPAADTTFFDDGPANVEAALACGMKAILID
ncbi:MAG: HAD family phosphatase, partial [Muribaculaceae bacterium]|nr:HAD family phosphatase [Muribaculaceae bacterium]